MEYPALVETTTARGFFAAVACVVLAGCGGTQGLNPQLPTAGALRASTGRDDAPQPTGKVGVSIFVPAGAVVKSLTIGLGRMFAINLRAPSSNITLSIAPGTYYATFDTYTGPVYLGKPTGTRISSNQDIFVTVRSGQTTQLHLTLSTTVARVVFQPYQRPAGSEKNGYAVAKCFAPFQANVLALDTHQNYLIGPKAPKPTLRSSDSGRVSVATPPPSSTNAFTLSHAGKYSSSRTNVTLTASFRERSVSSTFRLNIGGGSNFCGVVTAEYSVREGGGPLAITRGPDGAFWFAEASNKIGRIATDGAITQYQLPPSNSAAQAITTGSDGALWFTQPSSSAIGRITTSGIVTSYSVQTGAQPHGIAAGPDGALWFTQSGLASVANDSIGRITTNGTVTLYTLNTDNSGPEGITAGPDGALWFAQESGEIGRITTGGAITELQVPLANNASGPLDIRAGPDGNLWFTENGPGYIGTVTTSGTVSQWGQSQVGTWSSSIIVGPDGAMWFTDSLGIARITIDGKLTQIYAVNGPTALVIGPDASLWFTDSASHKIGVMQ